MTTSLGRVSELTAGSPPGPLMDSPLKTWAFPLYQMLF